MTKEHKCNKETEIAEMHTILKRLDKSLNGNGKEGLIGEWQQHKGGVKALKWVWTSVSALVAIIISLAFKIFSD